MLLSGDRLQITAQIVQGVYTSLNVYFYEYIEGDSVATYANIADLFQGFLTSAVMPVIVGGSVANRIKIENVTNELDIFERPITVNGTASGDPLPQFNAWSFQLVRTTKITRHGQKRIPFLSESDVASGVATGSALTRLATLATAMGSPLESVVGPVVNYSINPVIVARVETPPGSGNYVLNPAVINPVQSAQYMRVSTQNSRKVY